MHSEPMSQDRCAADWLCPRKSLQPSCTLWRWCLTSLPLSLCSSGSAEVLPWERTAIKLQLGSAAPALAIACLGHPPGHSLVTPQFWLRVVTTTLLHPCPEGCGPRV